MRPKLNEKAHVRWMIRRDLREVLAIEQQSFPYPWDEHDFIRAIRRRNCIVMIAEVNERVMGFMVYTLEKHGLYIDNLAVHPSHVRDGYGTQMIDKLKSKLSYERRHEIRARTADWNLGAHLFFRSQGFIGGVIHDGYRLPDGSYCDAYEFSYDLCQDLAASEASCRGKGKAG